MKYAQKQMLTAPLLVTQGFQHYFVPCDNEWRCVDDFKAEIFSISS